MLLWDFLLVGLLELVPDVLASFPDEEVDDVEGFAIEWQF
jgi:hypothetical protein